MTGETIWLTPAAHRKLLDELHHLEGEGRLDASERIAEARSHGDIRENADYDAAKNEQGMMEARIRKIRQILDHAEVHEVGATDKVEIGSLVTVVDEDGDQTEYFIATPENKIPGVFLASPGGPLGTALLGAAVGDDISYEAPGGVFTVVVAGIRPFDGD
ncbi:MAG: transcription elongation factor GreA [Gammaproteobacteria bacterium]|nr:transcription elongation factor GreA [Gammaproteobacteria bacterium]